MTRLILLYDIRSHSVALQQNIEKVSTSVKRIPSVFYQPLVGSSQFKL